MYTFRVVFSIFIFIFFLGSVSNAQTNGNSNLQVESFKSGPLTITPLKSTIFLKSSNSSIYIIPTIRFKLKNISAAAINVILFRNSIDATDNLGQKLFQGYGDIRSSGITLATSSNFSDAFRNESSLFTTLYPDQSLDAQVSCNNGYYINDPNNSFARTHNPNSLNFTASLGIVTQDNNTRIIPISLSDIPVYTGTK